MAEEKIIVQLSLQGAEQELRKLEKLSNEIKNLASEKKVLAKREKELTEEIKKNGKATSSQKEELAALETQQVKNNALLKLSRATYRENERQLINNTKAQELQKGSLQQLRAELSKDTFAYNQLSKAEQKNAQIGGVLQKKIRAQSDALKKLESNLGDNRREVGNYSTAFKKAGATLSKFGAALGITAGIAALTRVFSGAVKTAKEFEQGNANLAAVLGKTSSDIKELTEDAKRLGAVTSFTASEVSQLQTEFAKLGFNEKQILNATEATLDLAAATGSELGEAAAIAGATLGGFGLEAVETQRVTDVMAKSFSTSALDLERFKESMKTAAPAAKAVGISVEETTALLGTLANAGLAGSRAGNNLKTSLINLNNAGLTLDEGLLKVSNSQDKLAEATRLVGKDAAASFLVLAEGTETTKSLKTGLENAGGAAKKMADEQLNTLTGQTKILGSAWEGFVLSLLSGDSAFSSISKSIVQSATGMLAFFTATKDSNKESFNAVKANRNLADSSQELLNEYEDLVSDGIEPTAEEKEKLEVITLRLKERLGESVVAIDKETGALTLNTESVRERIKLKRFSADQEAATLASRLKGVQEEIKAQERQLKTQNKTIETSTKSREIARKKDFKSIEQQRKLLSMAQTSDKKEVSERIKSLKEIADQRDKNSKNIQESQLITVKTRKEISISNEKLKEQREKEAELIKQLSDLNFTAADAESLFSKEKDKSKKSSEESATSTEKEVKATKSLITQQKELKKLAQDLPETTEAEIAAKNSKIELIDKEISRLKNLGKATKENVKEEKKQIEEKSKEDLTAIDKKIEGLKLARQLELSITDETNEERFNKERELLEKINALRIEKATKSGEQLAEEETLSIENKKERAVETERIVGEAVTEQKLINEIERANLLKVEQERIDAEKAEAEALLKSKSVELAAQGGNALVQIASDKANREKDVELAALNAKLENGLITQEQFEAKRNQIEKKAFEQKKKRDIAIVAIDLAKELSAIQAAAAANPANALTFGAAGISQAAVLSAFAIGKSAIQTGIIGSQKYEKGGVINGPSHAFGGVNIGNNQEAEGGEAIINKRSTSKHLNLLSAINQDGGGVPFTGASAPNTGTLAKFGNGGIASTTNVTTQTLDLEDLENRISAAVGSIQVQNVASETTGVANRVQQIEDSASF